MWQFTVYKERHLHVPKIVVLFPKTVICCLASWSNKLCSKRCISKIGAKPMNIYLHAKEGGRQ